MKISKSHFFLSILLTTAVTLTLAKDTKKEEYHRRFEEKTGLSHKDIYKRINEKRREKYMNDESYEESVSRVREHDERRLAKMKEIIGKRKTALQAHHSGRELLADEELERYQRQMRVFQRKLDERDAMDQNEYEDHIEEMARSMRESQIHAAYDEF